MALDSWSLRIYLTILVATLSYYLLEKPILNLKDRFFDWSPPAVEKNAR
jgi:peptidoglycan/LPS O-acetylase OafA/YrhL